MAGYPPWGGFVLYTGHQILALSLIHIYTSALIIIIRFRVFDKPWIHLHFLHINQNYQGLLKNIIIKTY